MMQLAQLMAEQYGSVWEKLSEHPDRVYFPNFGDGDNVLRSGIDIDRVLFTVPGTNFKIYWYGFLIAVGMVLAMIYGFKKMKKVGIDPDRATDAVIGGFFGAIIGARLYYIVFSDNTPLSKFFDFRDGGVAIYGGIIGAILVGGIIVRMKKLRLLTMLDVAAPCFFIGQAIGRWGNFFNQEAFGTNTDLPWGMMSNTTATYIANHYTDAEVVATRPIHPCFLYESLWCLAGFILLHLYFKHRKFDGEVFLFYTGWYGLGRAFIEGLRTDSLYIGSVRVSQLLAAVCFVASVVIIIVVRLNIRKYKDYVFFKDTELSKEQLLQYENYKRIEKERKELKAKIAEAKSKDEDTAELEKQYDEMCGEEFRKRQAEALVKAEESDLKAAAERKLARTKLKEEQARKRNEDKPEESKDEPKSEDKSEESKDEPKPEDKSEKSKDETKPQDESEESKDEPKPQDKSEKSKDEPKPQDKSEESKDEPKSEDKSEESKDEPKSEDKSEKTKDEPKPQDKPEKTKDEPKSEKKTEQKPKQSNQGGNNSAQKKNNNNRNKNRNGNKNNDGNKQGGNKQGNNNKQRNKQGNKHNNNNNKNKQGSKN